MAVRFIILMICASALGGCGGLLTTDQPAAQVYWLEPVTRHDDERAMGERASIRVTVKAVPGLDTDRIMVKGPGPRLNHYAGARWPGHLPEVLETLVRLSLESSGQFSRVISRATAEPYDGVLELEVREFFAVMDSADSPPVVHIVIAGYLDCGSGFGAVSSDATARPARNKLGDIVTGYQQATDEVLTALVAQVTRECAR